MDCPCDDRKAYVIAVYPRGFVKATVILEDVESGQRYSAVMMLGTEEEVGERHNHYLPLIVNDIVLFEELGDCTPDCQVRILGFAEEE